MDNNTRIQLKTANQLTIDVLHYNFVAFFFYRAKRMSLAPDAEYKQKQKKS